MPKEASKLELGGGRLSSPCIVSDPLHMSREFRRPRELNIADVATLFLRAYNSSGASSMVRSLEMPSQGRTSVERMVADGTVMLLLLDSPELDSFHGFLLGFGIVGNPIPPLLAFGRKIPLEIFPPSFLPVDLHCIGPSSQHLLGYGRLLFMGQVMISAREFRQRVVRTQAILCKCVTRPSAHPLDVRVVASSVPGGSEDVGE